MTRENWIDAARGFAIYLVVLGHTIQYATPNNYNPYNNEMFIIIYSFHMPLFMFISGYLFYYTANRYTLGKGILNKIKGIMIPCAMWTLVQYVIDIVFFDYEKISLLEYLDYFYYSNWFLWAVFYCSLVGLCMKYIFKDKLIGYILIMLASNFIPLVGNLSGFKRMLPFFIMGIMMNRYQIFSRLSKKKQYLLFALLTGIFLGLMFVILGANKGVISYGALAWAISPIVTLLSEIIGSMVILLGFYILTKKCKLRIWSELGKMSIGIYMISGILFWFVVQHYMRISDSYRYAMEVMYVFIVSIVITVFSYGMSKLLGLSKVTTRLFLGK